MAITSSAGHIQTRKGKGPHHSRTTERKMLAPHTRLSAQPPQAGICPHHGTRSLALGMEAVTDTPAPTCPSADGLAHWWFCRRKKLREQMYKVSLRSLLRRKELEVSATCGVHLLLSG